MTTKELEARTGMTRANLRFYEQEGLISPGRKENGYRSYSEEDAQTLLRVKLLRSLDFSLEDIRRLQDGTLSLPAAMAERSRALAEASAALATAQELCRTIEREVPDYASLDAPHYLEQLARPARPIRSDEPEPHPWLRYFARGLDVGLAGLVVSGVGYLGLHVELSSWVAYFLSWLVVLIVEPILICRLGTTPGKWIFGIRVEGFDGGRIGYGAAVGRTLQVFIVGEGAGIPVVNLICNIVSYRAYLRGEVRSWEEGSVERFRPRGVAGPVLFVVVWTAVVALTALMALGGQLPPEKGDLTVAQFAENFNSYRRQLDLDDDGWYLDGQAQWQERPTGRSTTGTITIAWPWGEEERGTFTFDLDGDVIRGVTWTTETADDAIRLMADPTNGQLAYLVLAASRPETTVRNVSTLLSELPDWDQGKEGEAHWADVTATYTIDDSRTTRAPDEPEEMATGPMTLTVRVTIADPAAQE